MNLREQPLWRWPLWSWKHFALTVVLLMALLVVAGRVQAAVSSGPAERASVAVPSPSASAIVAERATPSVSVSSSAVSTPSPSAGSDPVVLARSFVSSWARPHDQKAKWLARLQPQATDRFAKDLASTDPMRVPATAVFGDGRSVTSGPAASVVRVSTDNGAVLVSMSRVKGQWLVDGIRPEGG